MKIAFVTDIHCYSFNDFSKNVNCRWDKKKLRYVEDSENTEVVLNSRLLNILNGLCDMREYCLKNDIYYVLNGGDTFHKRSVLDVVTFNCVYRVMESFSKMGINQMILSGNHDNAINADGSPSSIEVFRNFAAVATEPTTMLAFDDTDEVRVCCLPWMKTKEKAIEFINENCSKDKILLAHLGVSGASLGSGYIMSDDYSLTELQPNKWKYVLLGHYHKPQVLHENTIYGGSPLQNDFGDEGDKHGFWVIDTDKRWDMELVPLDYPEFLTLKSDTLKDYPKEELEKNYIRVQASASEVEKISVELEDLGEVRLEIEKEYSKNTRSDINVTMGNNEIIETYVKETQVNDTLDSNLLINKGKHIMRKVSGVE